MTEPKDFCDDCKWLSPTESQQAAAKQHGLYLSHKCRWYHKFLFHHGNHPHIVKCGECVGYVGKYNAELRGTAPDGG